MPGQDKQSVMRGLSTCTGSSRGLESQEDTKLLMLISRLMHARIVLMLGGVKREASPADTARLNHVK